VANRKKDAIDATNSFDTPDRISMPVGPIEKFGDGATYTFAAYSLTLGVQGLR
jgi:hypothetical protein